MSATDVDGDALTYSIVTDASNGTTSLSGNTITYTPDTDWNGTDTITYKANDGSEDSNTATATIAVARLNTHAIDFTDNGSHSYITLPEIDENLGEPGGSMTVSLWLRADQDPKRTVYFASKFSNIYFARLSFAGHPANTNDGFWEFYHKPNDGSNPSHSQVSSTTLPTADGSTWHHVALVMDNNNGGSSGTIALYVDGSLLISDTYDTSLDFRPTEGNTRTWYVGSLADMESYHNFVGLMDDLAVWNTALSSSEITSLSDGDYPDSVNDTDLLVYLNFDNDLTDSSPNGNDGISNGTHSFSTTTR